MFSHHNYKHKVWHVAEVGIKAPNITGRKINQTHWKIRRTAGWMHWMIAGGPKLLFVKILQGRGYSISFGKCGLYKLNNNFNCSYKDQSCPKWMYGMGSRVWTCTDICLRQTEWGVPFSRASWTRERIISAFVFMATRVMTCLSCGGAGSSFIPFAAAPGTGHSYATMCGKRHYGRKEQTVSERTA